MIYFDHASTSYPKPFEVIDEIRTYLNTIGVSPGRGSYSTQAQATDYVNNVRMQLANIFNISNPSHISFTHNATHALNTILKGHVKRNEHVLACSFSHNAVIRPLNNLKQTRAIEYDFFKVDTNGDIDIVEFQKLIRPNTSLVIFNHASNVIGVRSRFEKILPLLSQSKIAIALDVAQTAGLIDLSVEKLGIDFLAGAGHKTLCGPSGIGFLYVKNPELLNTLEEGGSPFNASTSPHHPEVMPGKFEAGTLNYMGIAGLHGALLACQRYSFKKMFDDSLKITEYAWERLASIQQVQLFGTAHICNKVPIISFNISPLLPHILASRLDAAKSIAVRSGLHCAPMIHKQIGTHPSGTVRISFGHCNTYEEVDIFLDTLTRIIKECKNEEISQRSYSSNY